MWKIGKQVRNLLRAWFSTTRKLCGVDLPTLRYPKSKIGKRDNTEEGRKILIHYSHWRLGEKRGRKEGKMEERDKKGKGKKRRKK